MNSLVIDTSTTRTSCAVFSGTKLLFAGHRDGATEHAEALPKLVAESLQVEKSIDQVVVGMGPGPFTGLRVGIVFAQTFATARDIHWVGVCSLDGIERITMEQAYEISTLQFLNDLAYLKAKSEHEKLELKRWQSRLNK